MDPGSWIASAGFACAGGLAAFSTLSRMMARDRKAPGADRVDRGDLPWWLRAAHPALRIAARPLALLLPPSVRAATTKRLNRVELEDALSGEEFIAASGLAAVCVVAGVQLVGALLALPPGRFLTFMAMAAGALWPWLWLRDLVRTARHRIICELPAMLDQLILAVEAGCALPAALRLCVEQSSPGVLQRALARALQELRGGHRLQDALAAMASRLDQPAVTALATTLAHALGTGGRLGPQLRAQAEQRAEERFARAEKLAAQSPVKMLAPLILCMFPCTFLVIGFPILGRLLEWH